MSSKNICEFYIPHYTTTYVTTNPCPNLNAKHCLENMPLTGSGLQISMYPLPITVFHIYIYTYICVMRCMLWSCLLQLITSLLYPGYVILPKLDYIWNELLTFHYEFGSYSFGFQEPCMCLKYLKAWTFCLWIITSTSSGLHSKDVLNCMPLIYKMQLNYLWTNKLTKIYEIYLNGSQTRSYKVVDWQPC